MEKECDEYRLTPPRAMDVYPASPPSLSYRCKRFHAWKLAGKPPTLPLSPRLDRLFILATTAARRSSYTSIPKTIPQAARLKDAGSGTFTRKSGLLAQRFWASALTA